jgi:hypothetical protein
MRLGLLDQFPSGVPITVLSTGTQLYAREAPQRPNLTLLPLTSDGAAMEAIADPNALLDGLDLLADPLAALRALRRVPAVLRIFALVSHAAYSVTLLKFLAGDALAAAHPLAGGDIDALFLQSGWRLVDRSPLIDRKVAHGPIPYAVSDRGVTLKVASPEIAERLSTAGFVVVADAQ